MDQTMPTMKYFRTTIPPGRQFFLTSYFFVEKHSTTLSQPCHIISNAFDIWQASLITKTLMRFFAFWTLSSSVWQAHLSCGYTVFCMYNCTLCNHSWLCVVCKLCFHTVLYVHCGSTLPGGVVDQLCGRIKMCCGCHVHSMHSCVGLAFFGEEHNQERIFVVEYCQRSFEF